MNATEKKKIVIATKNPGKARDFAVLFEPKGYEVVTLLDYPEIEDVEETGYTFEANARKKAETIAGLLGMTVLADDSGICIDALDGQPGVFSARFAGGTKSDAANNAKVLAMLGAQKNPSRKAHFHCTLVLAHPDRESLVVEGDVEGEIAEFPSGDNGFGYDPLFYLPQLGKTMAELSDIEKNQISHRANALRNLEKSWAAWLEKEADWMIKILAVSDSHGEKDILNELALRYTNQVDHFVHCGDSELSSSDLIWGIMSTVMGNCDYDYQLNDEYRFQAGERNVLVVHGHRHSVRGSLAGLKREAQQADASLVFYGHTHIAKAEQEDGILFINPGSISQPRGTLMEKTYCIVTLDDQSVAVDYYNDRHQEMVELRKKFQML